VVAAVGGGRFTGVVDSICANCVPTAKTISRAQTAPASSEDRLDGLV
jgi:hypothetical protein